MNSVGQQQQMTYYSPTHNDGWKIQKIEVVGNGTTHYFYDFDSIVNTGTFGCDLMITVHDSDSLGINASHCDFMKNKEGSCSTIIEEREYVYCKNTNGSYGIVWKQNGLYHSASLSSHTDQIEEILPLLKVERVSLQSNSDHVTQ